MFFLTGLAKLLVISGAFYAASRLSGNSVIFLVQGLAMIYLGIVGAGILQMFRRMFHGT